MSDLVLHGYWRSSAAYRVRIALNLKGIATAQHRRWQGADFVLQMRAGRFHGFVVRVGEEVRGYVDRCPHMGLPLAQKLDDYLTPDGGLIACGWHRALFASGDGACAGGPCAGGALTRWPLMVRNGMIVTSSD